MRKSWLFTILLLLAVVSCSNRKQVRKPEVFLDEQQMINVLADTYLIESQLNQIKVDGNDVSQFQVDYYTQLFEHYGITDSIFELNMNYYTHHPDILERIMDSVANRFAQTQ